MKRQWTTILAIVLIIIVALFAMVNMGTVPVEFGFATLQWPLIMVILGSLLAGALIATLISTSALFSSRREKKASENRMSELERTQSIQISETRQEYKNKIERIENENDQLQKQIKILERENKNRRATKTVQNENEVHDELNY